MSTFSFEESSDEATSIGHFRWKIEHFFTRLQQPLFFAESQLFPVAGATWFVQVYRNEKKKFKNISVGCIDIKIVRTNSLFSRHSVFFSFTIEELRGVENQSYAGKIDFKENEDVLELNSSFTNLMIIDGSSVTLIGTLHITRNQLASNVQPQTDNYGNMEGCLKLSQDLKKLLLSDADSDVTLRVKKQEFPAHRAIIGVRSPVFGAMLRSEMKEKASGIVDIDDLDPNVFPEFLCFLYTGSVNSALSIENVFGLYVAADKYDVTELRSSCVQFMRSHISIDNICDIIAIALCHDEKQLLQGAIDYFGENIMQILKTVKWQAFLSKNPIQGNELLIKALQNKN